MKSLFNHSLNDSHRLARELAKPIGCQNEMLNGLA